MNISEIGEFGLIQRYAPLFLANLPAGTQGIGDDCAVMPWTQGKSLLITTDMLVEETHFLRDRISPTDLGYKSLAVNLSDIAAMGGTPMSATLSLALPRDLEVEWLDAFFSGLHALARESNTALLGGDTTRSPGPLVISVTLFGVGRSDQIKYRSGARPGDVLCVTGSLGDAGGGLCLILEERPVDDATNPLRTQHNRPRPHIEEGQWLAEQPGVHAMMDVSDGIDSDLRRIMESSGCGAVVEIDQLPISDTLRNASAHYGWNADQLAAAAGEDYCLLAVVGADEFTKLNRAYQAAFQRPLWKIGVVTDEPNRLLYRKEGQPFTLGARGYTHFS